MIDEQTEILANIFEDIVHEPAGHSRSRAPSGVLIAKVPDIFGCWIDGAVVLVVDNNQGIIVDKCVVQAKIKPPKAQRIVKMFPGLDGVSLEI